MVCCLRGLVLGWLVFVSLAAPVARRPEVADVLARHASLFASGVQLLEESVGVDLLRVANAIPLAKVSRDALPASEGTLISKSLSMVGAMQCAFGLEFPSQDCVVDNVLQAVVREVGWRGVCGCDAMRHLREPVRVRTLM